MNMFQIGLRRHSMFAHQPRKRRPVGFPVMGAQMVRLIPADPQRLHDKIGHAAFDLIKQPGRGRVKCVIEIKNPSTHMMKISTVHACDHRRTPEPRQGLKNAPWPG